jgi:hypothetical protein
MSKTPTIACSTFLKLFEAHGGDCSKFIKIDSKWNPNKKGNAQYLHAYVKIKGNWIPFNLRATYEQIAFWIAALTDEDAAKQTTELGTKKPIISRKSSISQRASVQIMMYPTRLDIDPKTGKLVDPSTLPDESGKSELVRVLDIYETYRNEVLQQRIDSKLIVDNIREMVPDHSYKISNKKICPIVQRYYGEKSPLVGQLLVNPTVRINLPFLDSGMAPKETYYMNDINTEQKIANKTLSVKERHYNPVPFTFTNEDGSVEPITDFNVHRLPMGSVIDLVVIKMSICASSQGISTPLNAFMIVFTKGERSKISIAKLYDDDDDDDPVSETTNSVSANKNNTGGGSKDNTGGGSADTGGGSANDGGGNADTGVDLSGLELDD